MQEQGSKIDELATANTDPAIRQRKWYANVHSCSKTLWQQQEKQYLAIPSLLPQLPSVRTEIALKICVKVKIKIELLQGKC